MTLKSIKHNPFKIVEMFEEEVAEYTGAPFAVAVDSCTNALFLTCKYLKVDKVYLPKETYLSVPQSIIHAGGTPVFEDVDWEQIGTYQLRPYPIWDSAKRLTSNMYMDETYMCLSFHVKKQLPIGKGGMILTDNYEAVEWLRRARYEGRSPINYKDDKISECGWNMYMTPEEAARGLTLMMNYPERMPPLEENEGYKDLTEFPLFNDKYEV